MPTDILVYVLSTVISVLLIRLAYKFDDDCDLLEKPDGFLIFLCLFPIVNVLMGIVALWIATLGNRRSARWIERLFGYKRG